MAQADKDVKNDLVSAALRSMIALAVLGLIDFLLIPIYRTPLSYENGSLSA